VNDEKNYQEQMSEIEEMTRNAATMQCSLAARVARHRKDFSVRSLSDANELIGTLTDQIEFQAMMSLINIRKFELLAQAFFQLQAKINEIVERLPDDESGPTYLNFPRFDFN
jgi:hypothetical protein